MKDDIMRSACDVQGLRDPGAFQSETLESSPICRVCELLQGGAVMNKVYQPHEGHVPYLLQLFIDFNLYGMNLLNLAAVRFRRSSRTGERTSAPLLPLPLPLLLLLILLFLLLFSPSLEFVSLFCGGFAACGIAQCEQGSFSCFSDVSNNSEL